VQDFSEQMDYLLGCGNSLGQHPTIGIIGWTKLIIPLLPSPPFVAVEQGSVPMDFEGPIIWQGSDTFEASTSAHINMPQVPQQSVVTGMCSFFYSSPNCYFLIQLTFSQYFFVKTV
jgi:hypothetical protein